MSAVRFSGLRRRTKAFACDVCGALVSEDRLGLHARHHHEVRDFHGYRPDPGITVNRSDRMVTVGGNSVEVRPS